MDTTTTHEGLELTEIRETYQQLGLATMEARAHFARFDSPAQRMHFEVVISTTSQPFAR